MKNLCIALLLVGISGLFACKKNVQGKSEYPIVYLNHCIDKSYSNERIELCFNAVVTDSRCPVNLNCFMGGWAIVNFTFRKDNEEHPLPRITIGQDTIIAGYKIQFIDLKPYPVAGQKSPSSDKINAEVKITKI